MWLLIIGNPIDGFTYYGPYSSQEAAVRAGEDANDWWIVKASPKRGQDDEVAPYNLASLLRRAADVVIDRESTIASRADTASALRTAANKLDNNP